MHAAAQFQTAFQWCVPVMIGSAFVLLMSQVKEPSRQRLMAILVAGAGAAYLSSGGLGKWEFAFCSAMTFCAYQGLRSYRFIGIAWMLHTVWDVLHHLHGSPLLPFDPTSSLGCAICDPVIAAWCFAGDPSLTAMFRRRRIETTPDAIGSA